MIVVRRGGGDMMNHRSLPIGKTYLQLFMHFFPMMWFSAILLPETNAGVVNTGTTPVNFGELLRFLGICLLMSTCSGWSYDVVP